jgi:hypothetical protein
MSGHPGGLHRSPWWRGFLCGESRSGPDPSKRGQHGIRKEGRAAGLTEPRGASSEDRRKGQVQRRSGLCSWIGPVTESSAGWVRHRASERILAGRGGRRSGLTKRAPFDEAARGGNPGGPPLGGESNPVKPSAGIATEGVRGNSVTFPLAEHAGVKEHRAEGSRSRSHRAERAEIPGKPGAITHQLPKLEARRQARLDSIMLLPRFRPGGRRGSCHPGESRGVR